MKLWIEATPAEQARWRKLRGSEPRCDGPRYDASRDNDYCGIPPLWWHPDIENSYCGWHLPTGHAVHYTRLWEEDADPVLAAVRYEAREEEMKEASRRTGKIIIVPAMVPTRSVRLRR